MDGGMERGSRHIQVTTIAAMEFPVCSFVVAIIFLAS
jgi:hypothetical protein